jgi:serine/threonine protein kinase
MLSTALIPNVKSPDSAHLLKEDQAAKIISNEFFKKIKVAAFKIKKHSPMNPTDYSIIGIKDGPIYAVPKRQKYDEKKPHAPHDPFGGFSHVRFPQNIETGEVVAAKFQLIAHEQNRADILKEFNILKRLNRAYYQFERPKVIGDKTAKQIKTQPQSIMLQKRIPGQDLIDVLNDAKVNAFPTDNLLIDAAITMLFVVKELHELKILHRDINLQNFMFDIISRKFNLIDFGFAVDLKDSQKFSYTSQLKVGTRHYCAPEIKKSQENVYNEKTEIYALGMTLGLMLHFIDKKKYELHAELPAKCFPKHSHRLEMLGFFKTMLSDNATARPSVQESIVFFQKMKS